MIAHRGDTINFSENTLEAFRSAFQLGADGIECDIHLHNNEIVVVHDYLFDRSGEYPSLSEVVKEFGAEGRIEIELKIFNLEILSQLESILEANPDLDYELTSSNLFLLPFVHERINKASLGAIFSPKTFEEWMTEEFVGRKVTETCKTIGANVAHIPSMQLSKALVKQLHEAGLVVHSHIYQSQVSIESELEVYEKFCDWGVDQCTFDNIKLLEEVKK